MSARAFLNSFSPSTPIFKPKLSYPINKVILPSLRNHKKIRGIQEELLG
jgi:hypothetical protein